MRLHSLQHLCIAVYTCMCMYCICACQCMRMLTWCHAQAVFLKTTYTCETLILQSVQAWNWMLYSTNVSLPPPPFLSTPSLSYVPCSVCCRWFKEKCGTVCIWNCWNRVSVLINLNYNSVTKMCEVDKSYSFVCIAEWILSFQAGSGFS